MYAGVFWRRLQNSGFRVVGRFLGILGSRVQYAEIVGLGLSVCSPAHLKTQGAK